MLEDIDEPAMILTSDRISQRRERLGSIPACLSLECGLSQAKRNVLRDVFHRTEALPRPHHYVLSKRVTASEGHN